MDESPSSHDDDTTNNNSNTPTTTTAVVGIIKLIDTAVADASASAATAANEVEEARRNARAASEVARRYMTQRMQGKDLAVSSSFTINGGYSSSSTSPRSRPRLLLHSPRSPFSINGGISPRLNPRSRSSTTPTNSAMDLRTRRNGSSPDVPGSSLFHNSSQSYHYQQQHQQQQSHTEELVALSIELDRTKQALEAEQMKHDETKSNLTQAKGRVSQLESQIEQLLNDMETQRDSSGRQIDILEQELAHARMRVEAAEEDANMALDIAKDNDERREQVEGELAAALHDIAELRAQVDLLSQTCSTARPPPPPPPTYNNCHAPDASSRDAAKQPSPKVVRFADVSQLVSSLSTSINDGSSASPSSRTSTSRPDRRLVASGRAILSRTIVGASGGSSPPDTIHDLNLELLTERRKQLRDRTKSLEEQLSPSYSPSTAFFSSPSPLKDTADNISGEARAATATIRNCANLLKASGRRLGLSGRWWNDSSTFPSAGASPSSKDSPGSTPSSPSQSIPLETLTRHYCTSVEVLVDRKQKEIVELESLCALWEQGHISSEGHSG